MQLSYKSIKNMKVTVMGLGLNGGGLQSALFFLRHGAEVTVTDLKDEKILAPSLEQLSAYPVKLVLGRHNDEDFKHTDLVIKNPGVPESSKYLKIARENLVAVETDISVFLTMADNPLIAVTGSKGKSTTVSAIYYCLKQVFPGARLGGNITVSPLSFLHELEPGDPVVLELSSWQLADVKNKGLLKPRVSLITNILPDHMNAYDSMDDYIDDKKLIFRDQGRTDFSIFNYDDPVLKKEAESSPAQVYFISEHPLPGKVEGAWLDETGGLSREETGELRLFNGPLAVKGEHNRKNLLGAALALKLFGVPAAAIAEHLPRFSGIQHRMELFLEKEGVSFYNDSAATIPHAVVAALKSLERPVYLITGGTDKNIDFTPLEEVLDIPEEVFLLAGSGTEKILEIFNAHKRSYNGPYNNMEDAVEAVLKILPEKASVILSPACASFGMFLNEFDRGLKYKQAVKQLWGSKL